MNLTITNDDKLSGKITYFPNEFSFQTEPRPSFWTSVLVDSLEIMLDSDGRITGVWGFCPHTCWKSSNLVLPESRYGGVMCEKFPTFDSRIPVCIANNWEIYCDSFQGWIRIGNAYERCQHIEVVSGLVLAIDCCVLRNVWIKF